MLLIQDNYIMDKIIEVKTWKDISDNYISLNTKVSFVCEHCYDSCNVLYKYMKKRTNHDKLLCTKCMHSQQVSRRNSSITKLEGWKCKGCKESFKTRKEYTTHHKICEDRIQMTKERKSIVATKFNMKRIENGEALFKSHFYKYNGMQFDSSWELAYWIYNEDNDIHIKRNIKPFKYKYNGKEYNYYPDFIIEDKIYEIKGDMFLKEGFNGYDKWQAKLKQVVEPNNIKVLYQKEIKPYLEYVTSKYGSEYLKSFKV